MVIFSYCLLGGIGFCTIYQPSILILGFYFKNYRAIAYGIAMCGSSLGTVCISPLITHLMDNYGWRRTFQIQAGMIALCGLCALTFRPLEPIKLQVAHNNKVLFTQKCVAANREEITKCIFSCYQILVFKFIKFWQFVMPKLYRKLINNNSLLIVKNAFTSLPTINVS